MKSYNESKKLGNSIKKLQKKIFNKKLKSLNEIKAVMLDDKMRLKVLDFILNYDIKIHVLVVKKENHNFKKYLSKNGVNKTYINLVNYLLSKISIDDSIDFKLDKFVPKNQESSFKLEILEIFKKDRKTSNISFVISERWKGIQAVDLIAWSTFQYFENNNKIFLQKIENKVQVKIYKK